MPEHVRVIGDVDRPMMEMIVFPIIKALWFEDGSEEHKLIGTAFFLDGSRRFVTARHVFEGRGSALDLEGASRIAVYCCHALNRERKTVVRSIDLDSLLTRNDTDIATGLVSLEQFGRPDPNITPAELTQTAHFTHVTTNPVEVGAPIYTIAYPRAILKSTEPGAVGLHFQSDAFEGHVTRHYRTGRDKVLLSWPCYETDMEIEAGASGGPVILSGSSGVVFAVNCASIQPHVVSHVSSLAPLVGIPAVSG